MLVLSRKKNESIVINNDIIVTVVEIRGDKVRLGIVAPKEVPVHRHSIWYYFGGMTLFLFTVQVVTARSMWREPAGSAPPKRYGTPRNANANSATARPSKRCAVNGLGATGATGALGATGAHSAPNAPVWAEARYE